MDYFTKVVFTKVRDVKSPNHANYGDAGTDFYVPKIDKNFEKYILTNKEQNVGVDFICENGISKIVLAPGGRVNIPSGIKMCFNDANVYMEMTNKSGIASKRGLVVGANTIDYGYRGEAHINVINTSTEYVFISEGEKIVQGIIKFYVNPAFEEVSNEDFGKLPKTERGDGGFGSSGLL